MSKIRWPGLILVLICCAACGVAIGLFSDYYHLPMWLEITLAAPFGFIITYLGHGLYIKHGRKH